MKTLSSLATVAVACLFALVVVTGVSSAAADEASTAAAKEHVPEMLSLLDTAVKAHPAVQDLYKLRNELRKANSQWAEREALREKAVSRLAKAEARMRELSEKCKRKGLNRCERRERRGLCCRMSCLRKRCREVEGWRNHAACILDAFWAGLGPHVDLMSKAPDDAAREAVIKSLEEKAPELLRTCKFTPGECHTDTVPPAKIAAATP